jgi:hypothetical protein
MNTLGKTITQQFFNSPDGYALIQEHWARQIKEGYQPTTYDLLSYAILRGKDYRKGFTPITNQVKLDNGQEPLTALYKAAMQIKWKGFSPIFASFLSPEANKIVLNYLPVITYNMSAVHSAYLEVVSV